MSQPVLSVRRGHTYQLPIFLPVYQPRQVELRLPPWQGKPQIGMIVNSFPALQRSGPTRKLLEGLPLANISA